MKQPANTRALGICLLLVLLVASCAKKVSPPKAPESVTPSARLRSQKPYRIHGVWYYPLPSAEGYEEEGLASWYGSNFHGKPTACGEPYDMNAMTAAHKTLPLGTYVKVSNLENGRSVIVRINDRGPFVPGRIIDLSRKASQELGIHGKGLARVKVEAVEIASEEHVNGKTLWKVEPTPSFRYGRFAIQIGSFREPSNAYRLKRNMGSNYKRVMIFPFKNNGNLFYRVQVGPYQDLVLAKQEAEKLRDRGFWDAFVVALERE